MNIPTQVKPAAWGVVGGAVAAMIIGFSWGGWVTGGTSHQAGAAQAADAVVQVLVPLCVAKAEAEPEKLIAKLSEFRGRVLRSSLSPDQEARLRTALSGGGGG